MLGCGEAETFDGIPYNPCELTIVRAVAGASAAQVSAIERAVELWRDVDGPLLTTEETPGAPHLLVSFVGAAPAFLGLYQPDSRDILINDRVSGRALEVTVAHEMGHAYGLRHESQRPSVMAKANVTVSPTPEDVAAIRAGSSCSPIAQPDAMLAPP